MRKLGKSKGAQQGGRNDKRNNLEYREGGIIDYA